MSSSRKGKNSHSRDAEKTEFSDNESLLEADKTPHALRVK